MKKIIATFLVVCALFCALCFMGCQPTVPKEDQSTQNVVELTENNYWKYITMNVEGNPQKAGSDGAICGDINGVLEYAFYEDVVVTFDVWYYTDGQPEEEYNSFAVYIELNAAGDAKFAVTDLGLCNVTVGKLKRIEGEMIGLKNYNRKMHVKSVTGKVVYSV